MKPVVFHRDAEKELDDAMAYYEGRFIKTQRFAGICSNAFPMLCITLNWIIASGSAPSPI